MYIKEEVDVTAGWMERKIERQRGVVRERETERERDRQRDWKRERERDRETDRQTDRQTETETETEPRGVTKRCKYKCIRTRKATEG